MSPRLYVFFMLVCLRYHAQVNTFSRHLSYPGYSSNSVAHALTQLNDDGYILCRYKLVKFTTNYSGELIRLNKAGQKVWAKDISTGTCYGKLEPHISIAVDSDFGYLIAAADCNNTLGSEIVVIKTDSNGVMLWSKKYKGDGYGVAHCVKRHPDGGFVIAGATWSHMDSTRPYIFKIDQAGNFQWGKKIMIGNHSTGIFRSLDVQEDSTIVVCGQSNNQAILCKLDIAGNLEWDKRLKNVKSNFLDVIGSGSGEIFAGGHYEDSLILNNTTKICLVSFDQDGNQNWLKGDTTTRPPFYDARAESLLENQNGQIVYAGYTSDPIPGCFISNITKSGTVNWSNKYQKTFHDFNYTSKEIIQTKDGGYALITVAGTYSLGNPNYSTEFLKLNSNAYVSCDGTPNNIPLTDLNIPFATDFQLVNSVASSAFTATLLASDFSYSVMCEDIQDPPLPVGFGETRPDLTFQSFRNVPNPASAEVRILYTLNSEINQLTLTVTDMLGTVKQKIEREHQGTGSYSVEIDCSNYAPGIYVCVLECDGVKKHTKMLIER